MTTPVCMPLAATADDESCCRLVARLRHSILPALSIMTRIPTVDQQTAWPRKH